MTMKTDKIVRVLSLLSFMVAISTSAAALEIADFDMDAVARNATTRSEHEAVAKYYEDAAKKMQSKADEQKLILEQYEDKSYLYGREAQDLQAHAYALVRKYEKEAKTNTQEAALHRQMALKLEDNILSQSPAQKLSAISASHQ
jgi:hypothetical protein